MLLIKVQLKNKACKYQVFSATCSTLINDVVIVISKISLMNTVLSRTPVTYNGNQSIVTIVKIF